MNIDAHVVGALFCVGWRDVETRGAPGGPRRLQEPSGGPRDPREAPADRNEFLFKFGVYVAVGAPEIWPHAPEDSRVHLDNPRFKFGSRSVPPGC